MSESQIDRIIAFGDSQTYGYFLTKDNQGYGTGPSFESWPYILGDMYNTEVINNGICGASNKEIWMEAVNFDYKEGDLVCILWSFFDRDFFPTGEERNFIVGFSGHYKGEKFIPNYYNNKKNTFYYKEIHTNFNSLMSFSLYKSHLALYLDSLNIPYVFKNLTVPGVPAQTFKWDKVHCTGIDYVLDDYAFDQSHYGPNAHKFVANKFNEEIK